MKDFIKKLLRENLIESINIPSMRLPKKVEIDDNTKNKLKNVSWKDLKISDNGGDGNSFVYLGINLPYGEGSLDKGIAINIQIIKGEIYQIHIALTDELQGLGLGIKIYEALIHDLGHLYSGKGRRMNPVINKIWDNLHNDPDIECHSNENGDLCMIKNNPDKDKLLKLVNMS
jgi:hypothetical protein